MQSWEANQWRWDAERLRGLAMEVYSKKSITSMLPYTGAWVLYCTTSQDNQNAPWNQLETYFDQCLMSRFWGWEHHWRKPRWTNTETCHCFFCRSHKFASQALWALCVCSLEANPNRIFPEFQSRAGVGHQSTSLFSLFPVKLRLQAHNPTSPLHLS